MPRLTPQQVNDFARDGVILLRGVFDETVAVVLEQANLRIPEDPYQRLGGRTGFHTAHLGHLLPEMQWLYQAHPGASW